MPVKSTADHEQQIVYTECTGLISLEEINHYQNTVCLNPTNLGYNELFDLTDSNFSNISYSDLISIAQKDSRIYMLNPESRFAFLTSTSHHDELADFYISVKSMSDIPSRKIDKFICRMTAISWLTDK